MVLSCPAPISSTFAFTPLRGGAASRPRYSRTRGRGPSEAGAELAWGAVMAGNEASLRTFARAGFTRTRDLAICLWLPAWSGPAGEPARTLRRGTARDLPALAEAFNRSHAEHNLWRPVTPERLGAQLAVTRHGPDDVLLLTAAGGDILAAGAVFDLRRGSRPPPAGVARPAGRRQPCPGAAPRRPHATATDPAAARP
ncbi:MAG: hypothetical protein KatS3mg060_2299 [Dehalococcoidia bacterium]|nr:MAG: hypothetical protein KatS3mg060_2299 [Dehalococcoidia bacterium]